MEPPVSLPSASGTMPAATAAAEPPDEPPGERDGSHGLRVGPRLEVSVDDPIANSPRLVGPTTTAPAARSFATPVASKGETKPSRMRGAKLAGSPACTML